MGVLPNKTAKLDTIKNYVQLIGKLLSSVSIRNEKPDGTFEDAKPMTRFENLNKNIFRKLYNETASDIRTNTDVYRFPLITYALTGMNQDVKRYGITNYRIEAEKGTPPAYNTVAQYMKNPIPYDFTFKVSLFSPLYSHCLQFIENFTWIFTPANVFTVKLLESTDQKFKLYHDTVIYLNNVSSPSIIDTIDEGVDEPIQVASCDLYVKGLIIPPLVNGTIIKTIENHFHIDNIIIENVITA